MLDGVTGWIGNYEGYIKNSENYAKINSIGGDSNGFGFTGGIVGNCACTGNINTLDTCKNYGLVTSKYMATGGIVGASSGKIYKCENNKEITSEFGTVGGIAGITNNAIINNSINTKAVTVTGEGPSCMAIGGIVGELYNTSSINNCANFGKISTKGYWTNQVMGSYLGGIAGMSDVGANTISNCYNIGKVTGSYAFVGGIFGAIYRNTIYINNCYSKGAVEGPTYVGGIAGYNVAYTTTENCAYLENSVTVKQEGGVLTTEGQALNSTQIDVKISEIEI